MKHNHPFIPALIAAATVISAMTCACSNSKKDDAISDAPSSMVIEAPVLEPDFSDKSFKGESFVICSSLEEYPEYNDNYIDNEDYIGEAVNDAVITRNFAVEKKYEIRIFRRKENAEYVSRAVRSGTVDFDLVYDSGVDLAAYAVEGLFCDLKGMKDLDLSAQYWAPSTQISLSLAGMLLTATCDISMTRLDCTELYVFNKDLFDKYEVPYPYDYVNNGNWTFDRFIETVTSIGEDADADGLWTMKDIYGIDDFNIETFVRGAGLCKSLTVTNYDGKCSLNVYTKELVELYNMYNASLKNTHVVPSHVKWSNTSDTKRYESLNIDDKLISFIEGHTALQQMTMRDIAVITDLMDKSIGIVPIPKYTISQKEYYQEIEPYSPLFAVPKQLQNIEKTGAILEYFTYESMRIVLPAYFDQTLNSGCMSDPDSRDEKTLDIVRKSGYYRRTALYSAAIYDPTGMTWDPCTTMLDEMLRTGNFSAIQKAYRESAQRSIDDFWQRARSSYGDGH